MTPAAIEHFQALANEARARSDGLRLLLYRCRQDPGCPRQVIDMLNLAQGEAERWEDYLPPRDPFATPADSTGAGSSRPVVHFGPFRRHPEDLPTQPFVREVTERRLEALQGLTPLQRMMFHWTEPMPEYHYPVGEVARDPRDVPMDFWLLAVHVSNLPGLLAGSKHGPPQWAPTARLDIRPLPPAPAAFTADAPLIPLYRAVGPSGWRDLLRFGDYDQTLSGSGMYFGRTLEGTEFFARTEFNASPARPMRLTVTTVKASDLLLRGDPLSPASPPPRSHTGRAPVEGYLFEDPRGGGASVHFQNDVLPDLYLRMSPVLELDLRPSDPCPPH